MACDPTEVLGNLRALLREATAEEPGWAARIEPHSLLADDLGLDSLEVAQLGALLRERYGPAVDLPAHLAGLDLDALLALTVGDLVDWVVDST